MAHFGFGTLRFSGARNILQHERKSYVLMQKKTQKNLIRKIKMEQKVFFIAALVKIDWRFKYDLWQK